MKLLPRLDIELDDFSGAELERLAIWLTNCLVLHPDIMRESAPDTLIYADIVILSSLGFTERSFALSRIWAHIVGAGYIPF